MKKKIIIILLTVLTTLLIVGCALQGMAMSIEDAVVEKTEKASHEEVNDTRNENNFINNRIKNSIKQRSLKFNHLINHEDILNEINKNVEIAIENLKEEIVIEAVSYEEEVVQETYTQPVQESTYIEPEQEDPSSQEVIQETVIEEPQKIEVVEEVVEEVIEEPVQEEIVEEYIAPMVQTYSIGIPGGTMKYYRGIDYNELCTNLQPLIDSGYIVKYNNYFAGHNPGAMGHLGNIGIGSTVRVSYGENDYYDYTIIDHAYASGASFADVYIGGTTLWDIMCTNSSNYIVIQFCVGGQNNFWLGQL